jgi:hypothetical protein
VRHTSTGLTPVGGNRAGHNPGTQSCRPPLAVAATAQNVTAVSKAILKVVNGVSYFFEGLGVD